MLPSAAIGSSKVSVTGLPLGLVVLVVTGVAPGGNPKKRQRNVVPAGAEIGVQPVVPKPPIDGVVKPS